LSRLNKGKKKRRKRKKEKKKEKILLDFGCLARGARGGCGSKAPALAARPVSSGL